jgi:hypothetical protein
LLSQALSEIADLRVIATASSQHFFTKDQVACGDVEVFTVRGLPVTAAAISRTWQLTECRDAPGQLHPASQEHSCAAYHLATALMQAVWTCAS